jgi:hypothetical protein
VSLGRGSGCSRVLGGGVASIASISMAAAELCPDTRGLPSEAPSVDEYMAYEVRDVLALFLECFET